MDGFRVSEVAADRPVLRLVEATADDARTLFALRNDPFVVSKGSSNRLVEWPEHLAWFTSCLAAPDRHRIFLLVIDGTPGGALRFDRADEATATISIYLLERFTGRGLGISALREGSKRIFDIWPAGRIEAFVIAGNMHSERAFARAGFGIAARSAEGTSFLLERPSAV